MNLCNPEGFKNEIKSNIDRGKVEFFTWFDGGDTIAGAFKKAKEIFERLMLPWAKRYMNNLEEKTSLDIGYGSGCQVLAASKHFKYALGIDVHEEVDYVEEELRKRNKEKNIALFIGDGKTLPIDNNKVDFISSWVTFLHIGTIEVVESNLEEMYRVMTEGAIAVIFFTRLIRSGSPQTLTEYKADLVLEDGHPTGFREGGPLTRVNRANLVLSRWKMIALANKHKFIYIAPTFSHDKDKIYGQHGIVIQKPKRLNLRKQTLKGKNK